MANYLTFQNIYERVMASINDPNQTGIDEVKAIINMVYLDEIMVCDDLNPCLWFLQYLDDSQKTKDAVSITGISKANPGVVSAVHSFIAGDIVQISGVVGMTEVNDRIYVVGTVVAGTSFQLLTLDGSQVNTANYTAWSSGGTIRHRGITLASGYEKVLTMNWVGFNGELQPIDEKELAKSNHWYDFGNTTRPERYLQKKYFTAAGAEANRLLWFPGCSDDNYQARIWIEKQPDILSAVGDVPILPYRFHSALIAGAISRLTKYPEIQIENAVVWPYIYKGHLEAIKTANRKWWSENNREKRSPLFLL